MGTVPPRPLPPMGRLRESVADLPALSKAAADLCEEYGTNNVEDALDLAFRRVYVSPLEHVGNWLETLMLNIGSGILWLWRLPYKDGTVKIEPTSQPTWGLTMQEAANALAFMLTPTPYKHIDDGQEGLLSVEEDKPQEMLVEYEYD